MRRGLLATRDELASLSHKLGRRPFDLIYENLQRRCAKILESGPITETMWRSAHNQGRWGAATAAVGSIQGRVFDLTICHAVDRNRAYRDRAMEELRNLIRFSTWTDPSHKDLQADLCTGEACATVAVALDWLAEEMTEADRLRCVKAIREKGLAPYLEAVRTGAFWASCYHNWNAVVNGGVALAGLLLGDEDAQAAAAERTARASLKHFFDALGREGGWDEGLGYWGYAMRYVLMLAEATHRTMDSGEIYHQRGMDVTGLFPVYFSPNGVPVSFGDRPIEPAWGVFYLLVRHYGLREVAWWLDRYAFRHDALTSGYSDAGLALLFRPADLEPQPTPQLKCVKAFNEIGWAAVADQWPTPSLYAALKTGDLAAHHAQLDMNSVQIVVDGEVLLHDPGSPDFTREYLSSEGRYGFYEAQSASHNTLTVRQREHRIDAVGSIVEAQEGTNYRWVAGDAGGALGEDVRFIRHVVMPVTAPAIGGVLVVLDEVRNVVAEEIAATWHTGGAVSLDAENACGQIVGRSARLNVAFAATVPLEVSLADKPLGAPAAERVVTIAMPKQREIVLASVFASRPMGRIVLKRAAAGAVHLSIGALRMSWRNSRSHLQLERVRLG